MEKKERTKLSIVIGLATVFVFMGYFRFLHGKITFFSLPERGVAMPALIAVPGVDLKGFQPAGPPQKMVFAGPKAGLRDIFAPVKKTADENPADAPAPVQPSPPLQFTGTIIGGKQLVAIINGQFLRKGEMIAGFKVVSIARNQVTLTGGGRKVLLNLLTGAEERSP